MVDSTLDGPIATQPSLFSEKYAHWKVLVQCRRGNA
jgi:hypothetical protein